MARSMTWGRPTRAGFRPGLPITRDEVAEKRRRFWDSKFGVWFEKIARIGLKRRAVPAELTHRPTEMAISMAADALFESLPKSVRKELKELPSVMERLQHDAAMMRRTVDELNEAIATLMNRHFVCIKVDREERPDLDEIYMQATLMFNHGNGGWPMTVFLTPDGRPFHAGTYYPNTDRYGTPSFSRVVHFIMSAVSD